MKQLVQLTPLVQILNLLHAQNNKKGLKLIFCFKPCLTELTLQIRIFLFCPKGCSYFIPFSGTFQYFNSSKTLPLVVANARENHALYRNILVHHRDHISTCYQLAARQHCVFLLWFSLKGPRSSPLYWQNIYTDRHKQK